MIRTLTNKTNTALVLTDFNGVAVDEQQAIDGLMFGQERLQNSVDVAKYLLSGELTLSDGTTTYVGLEALDLIRYGTTTKDGKMMVLTSDRPSDMYRHFTGCGDDIAGSLIGEGDCLVFQVPAGQSVVKYIQFLEDVQIKDGVANYAGAQLGSSLSVEVVAPPNIPYPVPGNGSLDLVDGAFVPNSSGTGKFSTSTDEKVFARYVNKLNLLGSNVQDVSSPEPFTLSKAYKLKSTVTNTGAVDLSLAITIGLYRKATVTV